MLNKSIWGEGEVLTLRLLKQTEMKGTWLDLAAGDGRYLPELLEKVNKLTVSDLNTNELKKIESKLSEKQKQKVELKQFDITTTFPFDDKSFDGVFCTGTLHLFKEKQLEFIFLEINRILKKKGMIILDFATDIQREPFNKQDESKYSTLYTMNAAKKLLKRFLKNYSITMQESTYEDNLLHTPEYGFKAKGKFILLIGEKQ